MFRASLPQPSMDLLRASRMARFQVRQLLRQASAARAGLLLLPRRPLLRQQRRQALHPQPQPQPDKRRLMRPSVGKAQPQPPLRARLPPPLLGLVVTPARVLAALPQSAQVTARPRVTRRALARAMTARAGLMVVAGEAEAENDWIP